MIFGRGHCLQRKQQSTVFKPVSKVGTSVFLESLIPKLIREAILASLDVVDGRRVVHDEIEVLPAAAPYVFELTSNADGIAASGNAPTAIAQAAIDEGTGMDLSGDLPLASGAPEGYPLAVIAASQSTTALIESTVRVEDNTITLKGLAADPSARDAALTMLQFAPEGYVLTDEIELFDDGTPLRLTLNKSDASIDSTGKLPSDLPMADMMGILGATNADLDVQQARISPDAGVWPGVATDMTTALTRVESGTLMIEGRNVSLTGTATPAGKAAGEAAIASLPEGFTGTSDISFYDDGAPFSMIVDYDGANATVDGKLPAGVGASLTADALGVSASGDVATAYISDDSGRWPGIANTGLAALPNLENGILQIADNRILLSGLARTPAEAGAADAALADLPEGFTATTSYDLVDDGTPPSYDFVYDPATGANVTGRLPSSLATTDIASALDLDTVSGKPTIGLVEDDGTWATVANTGLSPLSNLENRTLSVEDTTVRLTGLARTPAEAEAADAPFLVCLMAIPQQLRTI